MSGARLLCGDVRAVLATLPERSVQTVCTSPPYFGLRDYQVAGQIGLEPTPEAYVAALVEVFRQVKRVLREDGTLWLNLGDSYAGGGTGRRDMDSMPRPKGGHRTDPGYYEQRAVPAGLKPKDLVGVPWAVAFALRQPYYAGTIRSELDRIWLAAMLDAEGCLFIHKRKAGQHNGQGYHRKNDNYGPGLEIANTSLAVVERIYALAGRGSICQQEGGRFGRKQTLYRWNLRTTESREFVRELYPYLVAKQHQARLLYGCPSSGERAEAAHEALKILHNGGETAVDFPAPPTLFESGYYLRSDIVWSKLNPMPESVTDRPTKAHEYLFLLTKSERYYFDQQAIAEPAESEGRIPRGGMKTDASRNDGDRSGRSMCISPVAATRNARSVWTIATQPYSGAHFATFPEELARRCILAGSSAKACESCGAPWERQLERTAMVLKRSGRTHSMGQTRSSGTMLEPPTATTIGWAPTCACGANTGAASSVVLDPFGGSGTTAAVAVGHGRQALHIDLNPAYIQLARERIGPMLCYDAA